MSDSETSVKLVNTIDTFDIIKSSVIGKLKTLKWFDVNNCYFEFRNINNAISRGANVQILFYFTLPHNSVEKVLKELNKIRIVCLKALVINCGDICRMLHNITFLEASNNSKVNGIIVKTNFKLNLLLRVCCNPKFKLTHQELISYGYTKLPSNEFTPMFKLFVNLKIVKRSYREYERLLVNYLHSFGFKNFKLEKVPVFPVVVGNVTTNELVILVKLKGPFTKRFLSRFHTDSVDDIPVLLYEKYLYLLFIMANVNISSRSKFCVRNIESISFTLHRRYCAVNTQSGGSKL